MLITIIAITNLSPMASFGEVLDVGDGGVVALGGVLGENITLHFRFIYKLIYRFIYKFF